MWCSVGGVPRISTPPMHEPLLVFPPCGHRLTSSLPFPPSASSTTVSIHRSHPILIFCVFITTAPPYTHTFRTQVVRPMEQLGVARTAVVNSVLGKKRNFISTVFYLIAAHRESLRSSAGNSRRPAKAAQQPSSSTAQRPSFTPVPVTGAAVQTRPKGGEGEAGGAGKQTGKQTGKPKDATGELLGLLNMLEKGGNG